MKSFSLGLCIVAAALLAPAVPAGASDETAVGRLEWNARNVEHLLNRAGFGATPAEIAAALELEPAAFVASLMTARAPWKRPELTLIRWEEFDLDPRGIPLEKSKYEGLPKEKIGEIIRGLRQVDRKQFLDYADQWFRSMIAHDDPVRDHATLFWHGFFTSSFAVVRRKFELVNQHQFLRDHALGSFRDLVHGIMRDPAMLQYLDNNTNVKGHANENLARELMELFSLGEGNYTEVDVREAARALTGAWADPEGNFQFQVEHHDEGEKTILGKTGKFAGKELVDLILEQPACPRWVAFKLLAYFEGVEPSEARLADYAKFLRESDYELQPFLTRLFLDPAFYRDEIVGARIQGPIEYVVGICRRLAIEPPPNFVFSATATLGQCFYDPPTVKGWDGGEAWITNASLMGRGNSAGILLGVFDGIGMERAGDEPTADAATVEAAMEMGAAADDDLSERVKVSTVQQLRALTKVGDWSTDVDLLGALRASGARTDGEVARFALGAWLAVESTPALERLVTAHIARSRDELGLGDRPLLEAGEQGERLLRRLAHLILSLPEAQLG